MIWNKNFKYLHFARCFQSQEKAITWRSVKAHLCRVCGSQVAAWSPGSCPAGHGDTAGLGPGTLDTGGCSYCSPIPAAQLVPSPALHQVTWPSSAPGPISTQLPANDFTVIVTTVNTIICTSIQLHYTTTFPRHWSHQGGILDFLFLKAYSVAAIQNLFDNTIILHVDWLIKSCF